MPIPQLQEKTTHDITWKSKNGKDKDKDEKEKKPGQKRRRLKILFIIVGALVALGILSAVGVFAWFSKDLPNPNRIMDRNVAQSTKIYDRTGEHLLYEIHGEERRTLVKLEDIPEYMKWATVSIEDQEFYNHYGFNWRGFIRAVWVNITSGSTTAQGGSSITQQFVKNAVLTSEKTYTRKIKELVLSIQLESRFSKDEIMQMYLNEIPYGSNAYGVESASQIYFGKSAADITLAEAALLAALPQAPTYYSPYGSHTDELYGRQQYILDLMTEQDYITEEENEEAKQEELSFQTRQESITAPHFVFYAKEVLTEKYGQKIVEQGGLKVTTTLDMDKQGKAEEAVRIGTENNLQYNATNASLVSIDTKTGQVMAMVGSKDYFDDSIDGQVNVALQPRQPGSSFKPFIYVAAFKKGYTPDTIIFDLVTNFSDTYTPKNYDNSARGPVTMKRALASSLNIPAVKTAYLDGYDAIYETTQAFHYNSISRETIDRCGLSIGLGCAEVTLLEHTAAFAALSREGMYHPPTPILKIENSNGEVLEKFQENEGQRVYDQIAVQQVNEILSDPYIRTFGQNYLGLSDRQLASKTGTTNEFRDAWTIGYTPSIATGVWVGRNDNQPMVNQAAGAVVAAPIYHEYMENVLSGTPVEEFHGAENVERPHKPILNGQINTTMNKKVDKVTGKIIPDECVGSYPSEFVEEREFKETHTILYYVYKDEPRGDYPSHPQEDPQFNNWEWPVKSWTERSEGYIYRDMPYEECDLRTTQALSLSIISPSNKAELTTETFNIEIQVSTGSEKRSIRRVEYFIDSTAIDTQTYSPFQTSYTPTNLTNGFHKLTVKAYDDVQNGVQQSVDFSYRVSQVSNNMYFVNPQAGESINASEFPYTINIYVLKPPLVNSLSVYYYNSSSVNPQHMVIGSTTNVSSNNVSISWSQTPVAGNYKLYFIAIDINSEETQSDAISVSVTDD